jgi:hypothetical protein
MAEAKDIASAAHLAVARWFPSDPTGAALADAGALST